MRKSRYEIELGIKGDDKVRAQIREIDDGVASISERVRAIWTSKAR